MPLPLRLRATLPSDVSALFEHQLDPECNALAGTKPRDLATFNARWDQVLADTTITARVIVAGGAIVGSINCLKEADKDFIGYWIAREHWGKGIATRAIALMLGEFSPRPLHAQVAVHNVASARALERNGFVLAGRYHKEESERLVAGERFSYVLD